MPVAQVAEDEDTPQVQVHIHVCLLTADYQHQQVAESQPNG